jgi:hypothetical protein
MPNDGKTPWSQLVVGERVIGRGAAVWTLDAKQPDEATGRIGIRLKRDGEVRQLDVKPADRVQVAPLAENLTEARHILDIHTSDDGSWTTFPDASKYGAASMLAHLKIVHGLDVSDVDKPFTAHIAAHAPDATPARAHSHGGK